MTRLAIGNRMHTGKRKPFLRVQFQHVPAVLPVARGMTILAGHTELSLMMVGMTVGAGHAYVIEYRVLVTADTLGRRVRPGQRKAGFIVIELHRTSKR